MIANVNTFYQEDHDLALICLTFDAGKFDPFNFDDPSGPTEFLRRLQFHFSIGEAF